MKKSILEGVITGLLRYHNKIKSQRKNGWYFDAIGKRKTSTIAEVRDLTQSLQGIYYKL